ncbi:MAG: hypothetical protein AUH84_04790 [Thaumarchaeota archaeon 13_1_40CM_4_38_7]|nr:MAG: hypothetical protein AUH84_04790 [Thaumarchaeota archaeon 13_1_40CM_4_38_7]
MSPIDTQNKLVIILLVAVTIIAVVKIPESHAYFLSSSSASPASFGDITLTQPKMVSDDGRELNTIKVYQSVGISSVLTNHAPSEKKFTYIVQVLNKKMQVEYLEGLSASMLSGQSFSCSQSWIPKEPGQYTIQIFVWQSLGSPIVVTNVIKTTVIVAV